MMCVHVGFVVPYTIHIRFVPCGFVYNYTLLVSKSVGTNFFTISTLNTCGIQTLGSLDCDSVVSVHRLPFVKPILGISASDLF